MNEREMVRVAVKHPNEQNPGATFVDCPVERIAWMLESYHSTERMDMAMELYDPASVTEGTGRQCNNVERQGNDVESSSDDDDDVPLSVRCVRSRSQPRRSARKASQPKGFDPEVDGCSDKKRKLGKNTRCARQK